MLRILHLSGGYKPRATQCKVRLRGLSNRQRSVLLWVARDFQSQGAGFITLIVFFDLDTPRRCSEVICT
jgi:hypothetical protein